VANLKIVKKEEEEEEEEQRLQSVWAALPLLLGR